MTDRCSQVKARIFDYGQQSGNTRVSSLDQCGIGFDLYAFVLAAQCQR